MPDGGVCPACNGTGWLVAANKHGDPIRSGRLNKVFRCQCNSEDQRIQRQRKLQGMDGLTAKERDMNFDQLAAGRNTEAITAVRMATDSRQGLITLSGAPGRGKTSLLICAVNDARERGIPAVYTTVTDLLDYLRKAYDPKQTALSFDARWNLLSRAEVLALDELDEFNTTDWAIERFLRLMDERWRAMDRCLTLCATNTGLVNLPDKVASRLRDGRAEVHEMAGNDMRPLLEW